MGARKRPVRQRPSRKRQESRSDDASSASAGKAQALASKELICVQCPKGCSLTVTILDGTVTKVVGNKCKRGRQYAQEEIIRPMRMVTALVDVKGSSLPLSCKTAAPIPKACIFDCLDALRGLELHTPIAIGDIVYANVCGTGVDVVATKDIQ
jgi:CxxC motif-containing protein